MNRIKLIAVILGTITIVMCSDDDKADPIPACQLRPAINVENSLNSFIFNTGSLESSDLVVMSRNLYLGGDISALLTGSGIMEILASAGEIFEDVIDSEFSRRAQGLAREIEMLDPDIIALQEVSIFYTGPADFMSNFSINADCVEYDFLEILLNTLTSKGINYQVAVSSENADTELTDQEKDLRLIDRDVILVKSALTVSDANTQVYADNFSIEIATIPVVIKRSYSEVLVDFDGNIVRVVNTHLEVPEVSSTVNENQASELFNHINNDLSTEDYPIILAGDFNSGPVYHPASYNTIYPALSDSWYDINSTDNGFTCCYSADLTGGTLTSRIDIIFYLNPDAISISPDDSIITQLDNNEKVIRTDETNIWSSDHAGIVTGFSFQ